MPNDIANVYLTQSIIVQGDEDFWKRVTESHMARVLNGYVRLNFSHTPSDADPAERGGYVQVRANSMCPLCVFLLDFVLCFVKRLLRSGMSMV